MITYLVGSALEPVTQPAIIAHICNDIGAWGAGFAKALGKQYPLACSSYRKWHRGDQGGYSFGLGLVQFAWISRAICVANMVAQHGLRSHENPMPIRYESLTHCLTAVADHAASNSCSVHMPRIGCGLAGGSWDRVEPIIEATLKDVSVYVYDLPQEER